MMPEQDHRPLVPRIGTLMTGDASHSAFVALRDAFAGLGYIEGRHFRIEARFDGGRLERLDELAESLVTHGVDAIAAIGAVQFRAAQRATSHIPVVFGVVVDPVAVGLVASLERPGGNATGVTNFDPDQARTQIRILKRTLPGLRRLAILSDAGVPDALPRANQEAAEAEGLRPQRLIAHGPEDLDGVFAAMRAEGAEALLGMPVPIVANHGQRIADMALAADLPSMFGRDHARFGPLLAYGTGLSAVAHRMAPMLDSILRGTTPANLPVERFIRHELVVNQRAARAMGMTMPDEVLSQADSVIN